MSAISVKQHPRHKDDRVFLKNVAEAAQVSITTASMALAGHSNIGAETKRRVAQISAEMGYQPRRRRPARSTLARPSARLGQSLGRVGLMLLAAPLNDISNGSILQSLANQCAEDKVALQVTAVESIDELHLATDRALALAKDVDGMILMGYVDAALLAALRGAGMAHVVLGYTHTTALETMQAGVHVVANDDLAMGQLAAESLFAAGHRRIAFICEMLPRGLSHWRWRDGYAAAHLAAGIAIDPSLIIVSGVLLGSGDYAADAVMKLDPRPTGYVAPDPRIAYRFIEALRRRDVEIPPSSIVIGCDPPLADRYGLTDYPLIEYSNAALAAMALSQLKRLFEDSGPSPTTVHMPFHVRNLPQRLNPARSTEHS